MIVAVELGTATMCFAIGTVFEGRPIMARLPTEERGRGTDTAAAQKPTAAPSLRGSDPAT